MCHGWRVLVVFGVFWWWWRGSGVDSVEIKVGDSLAFGCGSRYEIHKVTRITPSGRIVCGRYTLNPDLSVRGRTDRWGPYRGEVVTPKILGIVRMQSVKEKLHGLSRLVEYVNLLDSGELLVVEGLIDRVSKTLERGKAGNEGNEGGGSGSGE